MGKSKAPPPPDPRQTSAAQTGTNVGTAIANTMMQNVDQFTPYGSLTYDQTGTYTYRDPYTGQSYEIPTFSATTRLSPEEQQKLTASQGAEINLAELAQERSGFLRDYLPNTGAMTDAIDNKLFDYGRARLDPRFERETEALRTRLANQGIAPGSEAYNREMELLGQTKNDAYNQLMLQGRNTALGEVNMPINQITALLSGSQVQNPNVAMNTPAGIPTTDVAGLINQNYNQRLSQWQANQAGRNSLMGGLFGLAGNAIMASDIRIKTDIEQIGVRDDGLAVYRFRYLGEGVPQIGFIAQEVEALYPAAVVEIDGIKHVNYGAVQ